MLLLNYAAAPKTGRFSFGFFKHMFLLFGRKLNSYFPIIVSWISLANRVLLECLRQTYDLAALEVPANRNFPAWGHLLISASLFDASDLVLNCSE
jgi:hypothetical protein